MNVSANFSAKPRNFAGLNPPYSDWDKASVVILPVPYDATTEWHSGTRNGPEAIINASYYLEWFDVELGKEIYKTGIHTLPDLEPDYSSPESMNFRVYKTIRFLLENSKFVAMLGGEHSISSGAVKAYREKYQNLSVLQLDAHADLRDHYLGTKFSHACTMRRILEYCPVIQVGIRSMSLEESEFIKSHNLHNSIFAYLEEPSTLKEIINALSDNVYITIDLDVFDPSIMEAVGTPEPGGLLWQPVLSLLRQVSINRKIVGFDVVELCPDQGPSSCAFTAAKLVYKLIGYAINKI
jgi:agmatinase